MSGGVGPGDTVVLIGTGGVSIVALQLAKARGARVLITSSSERKLERAMSLGADHGINYKEKAAWDEAVLDLTGGRGADLVLETAGSATFNRSIAATRIGGGIYSIGRTVEVEASSLRQRHPPRRALEQAHAQPRFERAKPPRKQGGIAVEAHGCSLEGQRLRDRDESEQLVEMGAVARLLRLGHL